MLNGRTATGTGGWHRHFRSGLVVGEVALSLVLLIGTGLMIRSFVALQRVDPGYDAQGVLTFRVSLPFMAYPDIMRRVAFQNRLHERLEALPGVTAASAGVPFPLDGQAFNGRYGSEEALEDERNFLQADYRVVRPGYFATLRTKVLEGRTFAAADNADSLPVVVVDQLVAERMWPNESAVGKRLFVRTTSADAQRVEVIGVVEHQRAQTLARDGRATVYFTDRYLGSFGTMTWAVRADTEPLALARAIRREVAALDPDIPVAQIRPMAGFLADSRAPTRFALVLIGVFGASALVLASVGLYGVLSHIVRQRTGEIGVRMAFGADRTGILRLVVRQSAVLTAWGLALGILASVGLTRVIGSMLVGVEPTDVPTFGTITLVFAAVAGAASVVPALRATQVDPMVALRDD